MDESNSVDVELEAVKKERDEFLDALQTRVFREPSKVFKLFRPKKCMIDKLFDFYGEFSTSIANERWMVVNKSFALNSALRNQYGYHESGHIGLMEGDCFKVIKETEDTFIAFAYNILIPAYKFCCLEIQRPKILASHFISTSFDRIDRIDNFESLCHFNHHQLEVVDMEGLIRSWKGSNENLH